MGIYVYPTDQRWFRFLRDRSPLDEVNFWQPGGTHEFKRLNPGDVFLFRLKSPINMIAGGGVFEHSSLFPLDAAWDAFREKNGVASFEALFSAIEHYRRRNGSATLREDSTIGCIILRSPFFLPDKEWIATPSDYHANLVQGKRFPLNSETGSALAAWATDRMRLSAVPVASEPAFGAMYGEPALVKRRLGQGAFRVIVSDAYARRCTVTGEKTLTQREVAVRMGRTPSAISRLEVGIRSRPTLSTLENYALVVGCRIEIRLRPWP